MSDATQARVPIYFYTLVWISLQLTAYGVIWLVLGPTDQILNAKPNSTNAAKSQSFQRTGNNIKNCLSVVAITGYQGWCLFALRQNSNKKESDAGKGAKCIKTYLLISEHFQVNVICIGRFLVKVEFYVTLIYTDDAITIRIDFFKVFFFANSKLFLHLGPPQVKRYCLQMSLKNLVIILAYWNLIMRMKRMPIQVITSFSSITSNTTQVAQCVIKCKKSSTIFHEKSNYLNWIVIALFLQHCVSKFIVFVCETEIRAHSG